MSYLNRQLVLNIVDGGGNLQPAATQLQFAGSPGNVTQAVVAGALTNIITVPSYVAAGAVGVVWATAKPASIAEALDRIAAAVATLRGSPIP